MKQFRNVTNLLSSQNGRREIDLDGKKKSSEWEKTTALVEHRGEMSVWCEQEAAARARFLWALPHPV